MEMWTLFAIQGHGVIVLLHMCFRPGRAERVKHPLGVSPGPQEAVRLLQDVWIGDECFDT